MRPRFWFVPCSSGDYRLTDLDEDTCRLTIEDPTPEDYAALQPFLATMIEMSWLQANKAKVKAKGLTVIDLRVSIAIAGPLLVGQIHAKGDTWTAVRSTAGQIFVNDGASIEPPAPLALPGPAPEPQLPAVPEVVTPTPVPEAAATFQPPRRGCPAPTACERRASEVLRTFCTAAQWDSWQRAGRMKVIGNHTGIRYDLFHRDEAAARGFGHTLIAPRADDVSHARRWGGIPPREVCIWRTDVPPEEEALAIKMAVEHREHWLLADEDGDVDIPAALPEVARG